MAESGKALTTGHPLFIMGNNCLKVMMHNYKVAAAWRVEEPKTFRQNLAARGVLKNNQESSALIFLYASFHLF